MWSVIVHTSRTSCDHLRNGVLDCHKYAIHLKIVFLEKQLKRCVLMLLCSSGCRSTPATLPSGCIACCFCRWVSATVMAWDFPCPWKLCFTKVTLKWLKTGGGEVVNTFQNIIVFVCNSTQCTMAGRLQVQMFSPSPRLYCGRGGPLTLQFMWTEAVFALWGWNLFVKGAIYKIWV